MIGPSSNSDPAIAYPSPSVVRPSERMSSSAIRRPKPGAHDGPRQQERRDDQPHGRVGEAAQHAVDRLRPVAEDAPASSNVTRPTSTIGPIGSGRERKPTIVAVKTAANHHAFAESPSGGPAAIIAAADRQHRRPAQPKHPTAGAGDRSSRPSVRLRGIRSSEVD